MTNWDDARFVLALARMRTIRAAAKSLCVNHTTVSRRITAMETQLSARLFEQTSTGYVLTASGRIIVQAAEGMEDLLHGSQQQIEGADTELTGNVHVHIPDIFNDWVCSQLAPFSAQHPNLSIHLSSETAVANLAKREADIALRFTDSPPENMVGQRVCKMPVALYKNIDFKFDPSEDLASYPWVRWSDVFSGSRVEKWTEKKSKGTQNVTRASTYGTLTSLIKHGAGIGLLSPWFAENEPKLERLSPIVDELLMDVWVLIHPDLRGVKRIKSIKDLLIKLFEDKNNLQMK